MMRGFIYSPVTGACIAVIHADGSVHAGGRYVGFVIGGNVHGPLGNFLYGLADLHSWA